MDIEKEKEFNFYFFNKKIKIFGREVSGCSFICKLIVKYTTRRSFTFAAELLLGALLSFAKKKRGGGRGPWCFTLNKCVLRPLCSHVFPSLFTNRLEGGKRKTKFNNLFNAVHPLLVPSLPLSFASPNPSDKEEARLLNLRLYCSISGANASSKFQTNVGLIKDNEDPELTTMKLPNGQQLTLSLDFIE